MEGKKEAECCKNENVNTALFTAGMILLMVCLKRDLPLFLVEQWRAWVFLVLNLVLLAIFFTSANPIASTQNPESNNKNDEETKEKRRDCKLYCNEAEACKQERNMDELAEKEAPVEQNNELPKLSKEELNERVEAFIAMFRQHLASDARKGRDKLERRGGHAKHMKLQSEGVNCFVLKVEG